MTGMQINTDSLIQFMAFMAERKPAMRARYEQLLAHDLSHQQWDGCFQRNILAVLQQTYDDALGYLQTLTFDTSDTGVHQGLSDLTKQVLAVFDGFVDEFVLFVVDKHRTSCALSNFVDEHKPDRTYVNEVKREIAMLWQEFALNANAYFLNLNPVDMTLANQ